MASKDYFEENGTIYYMEKDKRRKGVVQECPVCKLKFASRKNNPSKVCSKECSQIARITKITCKCANCNKSFQKSPSKMKNSKSGLYFCSRVCKEKTQRLDSNHPKAHLIRPDHFGTDNYSHHLEACKRLKEWKCEDCGCEEAYKMCCHHIDGNHNNNPADGSNWEVLCRNCHTKRHLKKDENGLWKFSNSHLTPREELKNIP